MDAILIKGAAKVGPRIEIARSFSFKLNLGNYQSADFFCSLQPSGLRFPQAARRLMSPTPFRITV